MCLGAIICDKNRICFSIMHACTFCAALVTSCATVLYATPLFMKQSGRPTLNEGMTQLIYILALSSSFVNSITGRVQHMNLIQQHHKFGIEEKNILRTW